MENTPQKSKALIITIIIVILLLVSGYLIYNNRDSFGVKTSTSVGKLFSPLINSLFKKNVPLVADKTPECTNKAVNPPLCTNFVDGTGIPTVMATASPSEVAPGKSSTISWTSINTTSCNAGDDKVLPATGTFETGALSDSKSYTIICTGEFGDGVDNVVVSVTDGSNLLPTVAVSASPQAIASGASSTVSWTSTNTTSCQSGFGNGTGTSGSFKTGTLSSNKSYIVTCMGDLGYVSGSVFVNVGGNIKQCSDGLDNDTDGLVDTLDPNCHTGGDLTKAYTPDHFSESSSPVSMSPDLISGFTTPATALINTPVTLTSIIRNDGKGSTVTGFSTFFTISKTAPTSNNISTNGNVELNVNLPVLSAGTNNTAKVLYTFPQSGTYYIRACADKKSSSDAGLIIESSEDNNCGPWTTFTVSNSLPSDGEKKQCSDGLDNDADGLTDALDPSCHTGGDINNSYIDTHDSEVTYPSVVYQCNDGLDNDIDGKIDTLDPNCHAGGDINNSYVATHDSEINSAPNDPTENKCLLIEQNPLTFTDLEKAKLAQLLRKYYIIAPTLKTQTDIDMIYREIDTLKPYVENIDDLINQCYAQTTNKAGTVNPNYTGPTARFGNPWYKPTERGPYYVQNPTQKYIFKCHNDPLTLDVPIVPLINKSLEPEPRDIYFMSDYTINSTYTHYNYLSATSSNTGGTNCSDYPDGTAADYEQVLNIW
ncbi:MAG: hypothetical protein NTU81_01975 [Candidatus Nomurabacteria bacterium]|nr:hypothetical protein [Candidatus Nomurabacteria bacterium]